MYCSLPIKLMGTFSIVGPTFPFREASNSAVMIFWNTKTNCYIVLVFGHIGKFECLTVV